MMSRAGHRLLNERIGVGWSLSRRSARAIPFDALGFGIEIVRSP